jgi:stress-induced-phosphoprotein 1
MFEMCMMNPQMLMQCIQMDPRFMEIFKELTGIDLQSMGEERAKQEDLSKEQQAKREAEEKKRAEEEAARKKAEAEAALPEEERAILQRQREAEAKKNEGNAFYKAKDFQNAIRLYEEAIALNPKEFTFYTNLAAVYFEMG